MTDFNGMTEIDRGVAGLLCVNKVSIIDFLNFHQAGGNSGVTVHI